MRTNKHMKTRLPELIAINFLCTSCIVMGMQKGLSKGRRSIVAKKIQFETDVCEQKARTVRNAAETIINFTRARLRWEKCFLNTTIFKKRTVHCL